MKPTAVLVAVAFGLSPSVSFGADKPETKPLALVTEFIRELATVEDIRATGAQDLKKAKDEDRFSVIIQTSTRFQLELRSEIRMLTSMNLKPPHDKTPSLLAKLYQQKIDLYENLTEVCTAYIGALMGSPRPDVDYGRLAAEFPKIQGRMDFVDNSIYEISQLVFMSLIDLREDSKHHASHLVITKGERAQLLADLANRFGPKLDETTEHPYLIAAAILLRGGLRREYKCADEPWE